MAILGTFGVEKTPMYSCKFILEYETYLFFISSTPFLFSCSNKNQKFSMIG